MMNITSHSLTLMPYSLDRDFITGSMLHACIDVKLRIEDFGMETLAAV